MPLTVATWNINSVRLRLPLVQQFLARGVPDVLCLQETKCRDAEFPFSALREMGYDHIEIFGQKGYHGVAILSRFPFAAVDRTPFCRHGHARHLAVTLGAAAGAAAGVIIHNFYVPAGGDEPDPDTNPKFAHKLDFIDRMARGPSEFGLKPERAIIVGDLNIAPLESDVWSHKALLKVVSHTPVEVEGLGRVQAAGGWVDAMREHVPPAEKLYTWWSYRSPDWAAADKGRRLDHIWLSPDLAGTLGEVAVLKEARGWDRPSDHVPATVELMV
ncbi:MAG TPA: exodeoxyribonuclease III [Lichenihabitans sp.]|nr:exodeoxyribonuclease III [Lichenihabitans sp.]